MSLHKREEMIWTKDGVWLQTYAEDGAVRLSGCGKMDYAECQKFCFLHDLALTVLQKERVSRKCAKEAKQA